MTFTYDTYKTVFGGVKIPEADFPRLEREAAAYIDRITYGRASRLSPVPDCVKYAVCAVAEVLYDEHRVAGGGAVKAFSNDGYSETLKSAMETAAEFALLKSAAAAVYLPLSHPLRYAGVV